VVAVADHQPATVLVDLVGVCLDVGGDLGLQRRGQHLPGTAAHDFIEQRPTHRGRSLCVGLGLFFYYLEHERWGTPPGCLVGRENGALLLVPWVDSRGLTAG